MPAVGHVFGGFEFLGVILVTAIPFGIYDLVEAIDNVESARGRRRQLPDHARADRRRRGQPDRLPDGQPVHQRRLHRPSRLEGDGRPHRLLGGDRRHGDPALLVRHHLADDGADPGRRDLADPALHRHADRRAGVPGDAASATRRRSSWRSLPHLAAWGKLQIDNALGAAGTNAAAVGLDKLAQNGILYQGLDDARRRLDPGRPHARRDRRVHHRPRRSRRPRPSPPPARVLTFFGFMHGEAIGIASSPGVAFAYAGVAAILFACAKYAEGVPTALDPHDHVAVATPAE